MHYTTQRDMTSEALLQHWTNTGLHLPPVLQHLLFTLDVAFERCEVILHTREPILNSIPQLLRPLGLVKPWFMPQKYWETDPTSVETRRLLQRTVDTFNQLEIVRDALRRSRGAAEAYENAPIIFEVRVDARSSNYNVKLTIINFSLYNIYHL